MATALLGAVPLVGGVSVSGGGGVLLRALLFSVAFCLCVAYGFLFQKMIGSTSLLRRLGF